MQSNKYRSEKTGQKEPLERVLQELRHRGRRVTPQRVAIIGRVLGREDHPTAEVVYRELREKYPMMALSTVYDTLELLVELGETAELSPTTTEKRFDPKMEDHGHLVCLECGEIRDFPLPWGEGEEPAAEELAACGFEPVRRLYQQFGYCARCRAGSRPEPEGGRERN